MVFNLSSSLHSFTDSFVNLTENKSCQLRINLFFLGLFILFLISGKLIWISSGNLSVLLEIIELHCFVKINLINWQDSFKWVILFSRIVYYSTL